VGAGAESDGICRTTDVAVTMTGASTGGQVEVVNVPEPMRYVRSRCAVGEGDERGATLAHTVKLRFARPSSASERRAYMLREDINQKKKRAVGFTGIWLRACRRVYSALSLCWAWNNAGEEVGPSDSERYEGYSLLLL
jgi:hypothetical protein